MSRVVMKKLMKYGASHKSQSNSLDMILPEHLLRQSPHFETVKFM
jgi:hypothetical protein